MITSTNQLCVYRSRICKEFGLADINAISNLLNLINYFNLYTISIMYYKIIGCLILLVGLYIYRKSTIEENFTKKFIKKIKKSKPIKSALSPPNIKPMEKCFICKPPKNNDGNKQFCKSKQEQKIKLENSIYNKTTQLDKIKESINDSLDENYNIPGLIDQLYIQSTEMQQQSLQLESLIKNNNNISGYLDKNNNIYNETNININKENSLLEHANEIYM